MGTRSEMHFIWLLVAVVASGNNNSDKNIQCNIRKGIPKNGLEDSANPRLPRPVLLHR